jgi:hypothetical protein
MSQLVWAHASPDRSAAEQRIDYALRQASRDLVDAYRMLLSIQHSNTYRASGLRALGESVELARVDLIRLRALLNETRQANYDEPA